jgi:glycosyltransferase involved in cell wall biosynthesis
MASGLPVVASAVASVPEVVADGVSGYVVPSEQPVAMADRINELVADPELRRRMGAAGRERMKQEFTLERCVKAHLLAYRTAIAHRKGGKVPVTDG